MGFTNGSPKSTACPALAAQLARALRLKNLLTRQPSLDRWAQEFCTLTREIPTVRVQRVLDWYCAKLGEPFLPQAYSAESFRRKFEQIESAMQRGNGSGPAAPIISPLAQRAADRLAKNLRWPQEVLPHLPALVQISQDRLLDFVSRVKAHTPRRDRDAAFLQRTLDLHLWIHFPEEEWFPLVRDFYCRHPHFRGDPRSLAFNPASERFRDSFWHGWAMDWAGDWNWGEFDSLLAELVGRESTEQGRQDIISAQGGNGAS